MGFLRFLRIFSFIGVALMVGLVMWKDIPFVYIVERALTFNGTYSYAALVILILFVAYPLFFLLTILVMKIKGWHVYWIYGKKELSLWGLFTQNEVRPFWNFLVDEFDKISSPHRFPYSVDYAFIMISAWMA